MHFAVDDGPREVHGLRSVRVLELLALMLGLELFIIRGATCRRGRTFYCLQVVLPDFAALVLVMLSVEVAAGLLPRLLLPHRIYLAIGFATVLCHKLVQVLRRYR